MQLATRHSAQALIRVLGRALLRMVVRLLIAFAVLMVVSTLLPNRNILGWVMPKCALATFALFPVYVFSWRRFGRLLKHDYPELAVKMGLGEGIILDGTRNFACIEAQEAFFKRGGQRDFVRKDLRVAAELYLWVGRIGGVLANLTFGSLLALIVAAAITKQNCQ